VRKFNERGGQQFEKHQKSITNFNASLYLATAATATA
jgi:hypothetical protein